MCRMFLGVAAAVSVAVVVQPASADDSGTCRCDTGDEAIAARSRVLAHNPKDAVAYNDRGDAYFNKGEFDRAVADSDPDVLLDPKFARACNNRGEVYEARNDPDRALADFDQALKLDPSETDARAGRERVQATLARGK